jgi:hypothetical protein
VKKADSAAIRATSRPIGVGLGQDRPPNETSVKPTLINWAVAISAVKKAGCLAS